MSETRLERFRAEREALNETVMTYAGQGIKRFYHLDWQAYQPGALPLLQYALTELFEQRTNRKLTHEAYQAIGGTVGALDHRVTVGRSGIGDGSVPLSVLPCGMKIQPRPSPIRRCR